MAHNFVHHCGTLLHTVDSSERNWAPVLASDTFGVCPKCHVTVRLATGMSVRTPEQEYNLAAAERMLASRYFDGCSSPQV